MHDRNSLLTDAMSYLRGLFVPLTVRLEEQDIRGWTVDWFFDVHGMISVF